MTEWLSNPAVQGGVAPFVVALVVVLVLRRFNLAGLAIAAGFGVTAYLLNGLDFVPLTATRKIIVVGMAAAAVGVAIDGIARSGRTAGVALAVAFGAASIWVFWSVLSQKASAQAIAYGATAALAVGITVALNHGLRDVPVRAGAAGLGLGLGAGIAAILGASATYGLYGIAVGAASGAFLLIQMVTNRKAAAGAAFTLPVAVLTMLLAAGTVLLAKLAWYALIPLALIPLAVRLPAPGSPIWLEAIVRSAWALALAAAAWILAWKLGLE